jgi:hypothetical protein
VEGGDGVTSLGDFESSPDGELESPASLRRKLQVAERLVERAKTPGAKRAAEMSVWMLREMLKP